MAEEVRAVESIPGAAAGNSGVEIKQSGAPEIDELEMVSVLLDNLKKVEAERDNYRKGMLKAKGKISEPEDVEEDLDAKLDRKLEERFAANKVLQAQAQLEETVRKQAKELKEAKLALANRSQLKSSASISGDATVDVPDNILSPAQIDELKAAKWSDSKIALLKKNMMAARAH